jgi:hypothetical protein
VAYRYVWRLASVAESVHVLSGVVGMVLTVALELRLIYICLTSGVSVFDLLIYLGPITLDVQTR